MSDESMDDSDDSQQMNNSRKERHLIAGKIYMIHLENFLTHTEAKVFPSELLNLIIGPNGTGKSSLVAAIIIGMGGSTKILSAHNRLSDYVKNGKEQAKITLVLYRDEMRNRKRFSREFGRDNKSVFHIDNKKVTEKQYLEEVSALNIQVGNLCQFLPQERVQDFAKQNPQELFLSTLKSVCSDELIHIHNELKELRNNELHGSRKTDTIVDTLQENERRVELLKPLVNEIIRQDGLVERKSIIEKKLVWMEFEEMFVKCKSIDDDLRIHQKQRDEAIKKKSDLEKSIKSLKQEREKYENLLSIESKKKSKVGAEINAIHGEFEQLENVFKQAHHELKSAEQLAADQQRKINENEFILNVFEKEYRDLLASTNSIDSVHAEMKDFDSQIDDQRQTIAQLDSVRRQLNENIDRLIQPKIVHIDNRIASLKSTADAKLNYLHTHHNDVHKAIMWLRQNKNQFRAQIYEPMMLEINVRSPEYCKYIENTVNKRDLVAFTCEDIDDMNTLFKIFRMEMKLEVNVLHSASASQFRFQSRTPISEARKFGGEIYLIDCFEAPIPILNYLCQTYRIHDVLIGNENIERKIDDLPDHINVVFSPTNRIQVKRSKYGGQKSSMLTELKGKDLLNVRISKSEIEDLENQRKLAVKERDTCYNKRNGIEEKINVLEAKCKDLNRLKNDKFKLLCNLKDAENRVKQQKNKLDISKNQIVDIDTEREKFNRTTSSTVKKMFQLQVNATEKYQTHLKFELEEVKARARLTIFKNGTVDYDVEIMNADEEISRLKAYCDRIGAKLDEQKQQCKNKRQAALESTENRKPSDPNFPYKDQFDDLPNDKKDLSLLLDELEEQINQRTTEDQQTLNEYNERLERIERLKDDLKMATKSSNSVKKDIDKLHKSWYPKIIEMVSSINQNFSHFMETMGCAGEIELIHPDQSNYDKYGIEIRVKYRNSEQLRPLDRFVQSGGERAVAIAVYSLSLQHMSQVPYRCVDEINQGMDPNNERRIFEMLVNNVAKPGQSQFFYVTPKLQHKMPFNEYTSCLTVFNGPYSQDNDYFDNA